MTYEEKLSIYLHKIRHHFTQGEYKRIKSSCVRPCMVNKIQKAQKRFEELNKQ